MCIMTTYFNFNNENCIMTTLKSHDVYFIVYIKLCQKGTMNDHLTCLTFKWRTISNWNQYVTHENLTVTKLYSNSRQYKAQYWSHQSQSDVFCNVGRQRKQTGQIQDKTTHEICWKHINFLRCIVTAIYIVNAVLFQPEITIFNSFNIVLDYVSQSLSELF